MEIFTQVIGFIGVAAFIISYQVKSNKLLYLCQSLGCGIFCVQFLLLGAYSGCISLALNIVRNTLLRHSDKLPWVKKRIWPIIFCVAFLAVAVFTWAGPVSLLALVASSVGTVMYWQNNAGYIRAANLFCASPCWLIYDIIVHSAGGAINEAITLVSVIVSVVRFGWKVLFDPESDFQKN